MKTEEAIRLIVIDDSSNDAEIVSNMLRNAGHAVHTIHVEDDNDLRDALSSHTCDMILAKQEISHLNALDAIHMVNQMEIDLPLVVLNRETDDPLDIDILREGARDVVAMDQPEKLTLTLIRELEDLHKRRRHRECEAALHEANERSQTLVNSSRDAIAYIHEGMHIYANESYLKTFGYTDSLEIEGMPIMNMINADNQDKFKKFLREYIKGKSQTDMIDIQGLKHDGNNFGSTMEFSPASYEGESCTQIIIRDKSLDKELEKKLNDLSRQDLVTGVYNRQYFMETLQQIVGKTTHQGVLLYIEPDDFKQIREEFGITGRDVVISDLANLLNKQLPGENDILARFEAHIFTAILFDADIPYAEEVAKKMLKVVGEHVSEVSDRTVTTTCSIGIAEFNEAIHDPQEILSRGETVRRKAITAGGNCYRIFNPVVEDMEEKEQNLLWTKRLKEALRNNRFRLLFQPIVSLHGDASENYEVLLRMLDEDGADILPSEFIPIAEKQGLMGAIDRWVLAHSVKLLAERRRSGKPTKLFVNLSATSLKDDKLLPWLSELYKAAHLEGHTLTLELDEQIAQNNLRMLKVLDAGLKELHIRFALSQFGANGSHGNLFKFCRPEVIKIDGNLIRELASNQDKVREITHLAKEMNSLTIAEYVEDANTLAMIWSCSVDYIQGYFLQEPDADLNYDFSSMG